MKKTIAMTLKLGFVFFVLLSAVKVDAQGIVRRTYSAWDYTSGTASQLVLTNDRGQIIVPLSVAGYPGIYQFNGYYWRQQQGVWYAYDQNPEISGAAARHIDMRTEADARDRLVKTLGSPDYKKARKNVEKDLNRLGGLSAISAEFMGFKPNETVTHDPTTSSPLPGKRGDRRNQHSQQTNSPAAAPVAQPIDPALGRREAMSDKLQVLQGLTARTRRDTLGFWAAAERWAHGEDSLLTKMEAKARYGRWNTLIATTTPGLVRSNWPEQADQALRAWGSWTGPTTTPLVSSRATPTKPAAPAPAADSSVVVLLTNEGDKVRLSSTQADLWREIEASAQRKDISGHLTAYEKFCRSILPPTGSYVYVDLSAKRLAVQQWAELTRLCRANSHLSDAAERIKRAQAGLAFAKATPAE